VDELLTVKEAAQLVGVCYETIRNRINRGMLRVVIDSSQARGRGDSGRRVRSPEVLEPYAPKPARPENRCKVCDKPIAPRRKWCSHNCFGIDQRKNPDWLSLREAAAIIGCTFQNVSQLLRTGTLADLNLETVQSYAIGRVGNEGKRHLQRARSI
jgi:hypothetical protein